MAGTTEAPNPRPPAPDEEQETAFAIGRRIADLIPNDATLPVVRGTALEAALPFLHTKNDLGFDTECFYKDHLDPNRAGVVTSKNKNVNRGEVVTSGLIVHRHPPRRCRGRSAR